MKKSLRPTTQGNESIFKKIKAKCEAKDKDKSSTLDTFTKSNQKLRSKKTNTSSMHTYTETTINSQVLNDISYKDQSIVKAAVHEMAVNQQEKYIVSPPKPKRSPQRRLRFEAPNLMKILETKDNEIHYLENLASSMNNEIDEAAEYIEEQADLNEALSEKDRKIKELKSQLTNTLQEIEHMKQWKKSTSIPNIVFDIRTGHHYQAKKEANLTVNTTNVDNRSTLMKIKSLSPGFKEKTAEKKTKFKMYCENPAKALLSKYSKMTPKKMKEPVHRCSNPSIKKNLSKYSKIEPNYLSMTNMDSVSKIKRSQVVLAELKTPSPKKKRNIGNSKLRDIVEGGLGKIEDRNRGAGYLDLRERKEKVECLRYSRPDISNEYTMLLDKYASLVEDYKESNELLIKRNEYLEKQLRLPAEKLLNVSTLEY